MEKTIFQLWEIPSISPKPGDRIYLYGDLGSGKTTFVRHSIAAMTGGETTTVKSPTYTYYRQYGNIFHFDLYRIEDYDTFINIGAEEVFEQKDAILFVEWPELIEDRYAPTYKIRFGKVEWDENSREILIEKV